jgi:hypothetical protein
MAIQYSGTTIINNTFTAATKSAMQQALITNLIAAGWTQTVGVAGGGAQTVTISIASPGIITFPAAHNLRLNDVCTFQTTGALPGGIAAGTLYYVKNILNSTQVTLVTAFNGTTNVNTSGTQSGTQTVTTTCVMKSMTTPWGIAAAVRFQDNNGYCITCSLENVAGTYVCPNDGNNGQHLFPNAGITTFHIVANGYQAFIAAPVATPSRSYVAFGTPYVPTFLQSLFTDLSWCQGISNSDGDTATHWCFRNSVHIENVYTPGNYQSLWNLNQCNLAAAGNTWTWWGMVTLVAPQTSGGVAGTFWHDMSAIMYEPLIAWGNTVNTNGAPASAGQLIRGQLWDSVLICASFPGDTVSNFAGHNWWNLTDNDTGNQGSLWLCTS